MIGWHVALALGMAEVSEKTLRAAFEAMDADGSGRLSRQEVGAALRRNLGGYASEQAIAKYIQRYDLNEDGDVTWREFLAVFSAELPQQESGEPASPTITPGNRAQTTLESDPQLAQRLLVRFRQMDSDRSGTLTYDEVAAAMRAEGREDSWPALRREMASLDHSRDGRITYAEFLSTTLGHPAEGEASIGGIDESV